MADAVGFMLAGYETTSVALIFATYLLATHPEVQEKVFNEIHDYFDENSVCIQYRHIGHIIPCPLHNIYAWCSLSYEGLYVCSMIQYAYNLLY